MSPGNRPNQESAPVITTRPTTIAIAPRATMTRPAERESIRLLYRDGASCSLALVHSLPPGLQDTQGASSSVSETDPGVVVPAYPIARIRASRSRRLVRLGDRSGGLRPHERRATGDSRRIR